MTIVSYSTNDKDIEFTNLEVHVIMCSHRNKVLEDRIERLENKVDDMIEQSKTNKKIIIGAVVTIIASTITSVITLLIRFI